MDRFWFKGGLFIDGLRALKKRGTFTFLHKYRLPLIFLSYTALMLWSTWRIPYWFPEWRLAVSDVMHANPIFVLALSISVLGPLFWLLLWKLPQWQVAIVPEVKDRLDLESKSRQTLSQMLGGAALLIGLYFTAQTLDVSRQGQITDRFTKAIDQLGKDDNLTVRLGGIYALERIAKNSDYDYWAIMEVLTTFVREQSHVQEAIPNVLLKESTESKRQRVPALRADIQAILTVLGRRIRTFKHGEPRLILSNAQLPNAYLRLVHLEGAYLDGAHLEGANLNGAHLEEAYLITTYLERAHLNGAHLERTKLQGTDLWTVRGLTQDQVNTACIDANTRLPERLTKPAPCSANRP